MTDSVKYTTYKPSTSLVAWSKDFSSCPLRTSDELSAYNRCSTLSDFVRGRTAHRTFVVLLRLAITPSLACRCYLNALVQFLSGVPDFTEGLQSSFKAAGLCSDRSWTQSLANSLRLTIQHVRTMAWTGQAGDITHFVNRLEDHELTNDMIQWLIPK